MLSSSKIKIGFSGFTLVEMLAVVSIISVLIAIITPVLSNARDSGKRTACLSNEKQLGQAMLLYAQDYDQRFPYASMHEIVWTYEIYPYVKNTHVYHCPSWNKPADSAKITFANGETIPEEVSYIYNLHIGGEWQSPTIKRPDPSTVNREIGDLVAPSATILLAEGNSTAVVNVPPTQWKQKPYSNLTSIFLIDSYYSAVITPQASGPGAPYVQHNNQASFLFADLHVRTANVDKFYVRPEIAIAKEKRHGYSPCLDPLAGCIQ